MQDYLSLADEMDKFLYEYVKGMIKGFDRKTGSFVLQMRTPEDSSVTGNPNVLVSQILEGLRAALDYSTFAMSKRNHSDLNERIPQFVIADSKTIFNQQAKSKLKGRVRLTV